MDYKAVDPNLVVADRIDISDMDFYDIMNEPFEICGVYYSEEDGKFVRMPKDKALKVSDGVDFLRTHTSGGRIRFKCDSDEYAIITRQPYCHPSPISTNVLTSGFDIYVDGVYNRTFSPVQVPENGGYQSRVKMERHQDKLSDITIHMPPYGQVSSVLVGIKKGSKIERPTPYKDIKPVVFYGSSITQGAAASRPGNIYQNILSRRLNFDFINLGFSGNCKAEPEMAEYINSLDMSVFVYDYDHNAKNLEDLVATHEPFYHLIREKNPTLPIVFMSRPLYLLNDVEIKRLVHIKEVYERAKANGDNNVYFIDGSKVTENFGQHDATVDGVHPNDLGFFGIAEKMEPVFKEIFDRI
ncbi:MAG: hypothetical protein E7396_03115 [Ruminococcaceae bacterium]|nr:hypothetical protein [Oscillospiraceae bacterium]